MRSAVKKVIFTFSLVGSIAAQAISVGKVDFEKKSVTGVEVELASSKSNNVSVCGAHVGGLWSLTRNNVAGIQVGGLAALAEECSGIQAGGWVSAAKDISGVQIGGLGSGCFNEMNGVQIGGWGSICEKVNGIQIGLGSMCFNEMNGVQIGGLVSACFNEMNGVQIGVFGPSSVLPKENSLSPSNDNEKVSLETMLKEGLITREEYERMKK